MKTRPTLAHVLIGAVALLAVITLPASAQSTEEIPLGSEIPSASTQLDRVDGGQASLGSLQGSAGTVVVFWSNQCPWAEKYENRLLELVNAFSGQDIGFALINSNDPSAYPQESADASAERASSANYPSALAYLADPSSDIARSFGAERTPHVFVFDGNGSLVYVGTVDDSPGDAGNVTDRYLREALDAVVAGSNVPVPQTKAFGCTIKYTN